MLNYSWLVILLLHSVLPQTTDKYSDEDRPYKFGFNIQGYQHRQEEKDERGLIKGEYGFITADGYYRVTVYATDENGDFKILSMKNYYVGFPPEDPTTTPGPSGGSSAARKPTSFGGQQGPTGGSIGGQQGPSGRALGGFPQSSTTPKAFTRPQGIAACSDCSIPTTSPRPSPNVGINTGDFRSGRQEGIFGNAPGRGQSPSFPQATPRGQFQQGRTQTGGQGPSFSKGFPKANTENSGLGFNSPATGQNQGGTFTGGNARGGAFGGGISPAGLGGGSPGTGAFGGKSPTLGGFGDSGFPGRTDFTANNQIGGSPNRRPQPGEVRDGLPPGVTLNDIKDLLYTFNYTVGFHGHHEDGYRNGDKKGDYFFDGRDGVERKVEYLANEFGYQPNITLIDLPENDVRRPNEQTEKEYGLKGYEFKWFYRK